MGSQQKLHVGSMPQPLLRPIAMDGRDGRHPPPPGYGSGPPGSGPPPVTGAQTPGDGDLECVCHWNDRDGEAGIKTRADDVCCGPCKKLKLCHCNDCCGQVCNTRYLYTKHGEDGRREGEAPPWTFWPVISTLGGVLQVVIAALLLPFTLLLRLVTKVENAVAMHPFTYTLSLLYAGLVNIAYLPALCIGCSNICNNCCCNLDLLIRAPLRLLTCQFGTMLESYYELNCSLQWICADLDLAEIAKGFRRFFRFINFFSHRGLVSDAEYDLAHAMLAIPIVCMVMGALKFAWGLVCIVPCSIISLFVGMNGLSWFGYAKWHLVIGLLGMVCWTPFMYCECHSWRPGDQDWFKEGWHWRSGREFVDALHSLGHHLDFFSVGFILEPDYLNQHTTASDFTFADWLALIPLSSPLVGAIRLVFGVLMLPLAALSICVRRRGRASFANWCFWLWVCGVIGLVPLFNLILLHFWNNREQYGQHEKIKKERQSLPRYTNPVV